MQSVLVHFVDEFTYTALLAGKYINTGLETDRVACHDKGCVQNYNTWLYMSTPEGLKPL